MSQWTTTGWSDRQATPVDVEVLEESAIAQAQATIQNAITESRLSRTELAKRMGRPKSFISRMLRGDHNLTVRTLARAMAACGREVSFSDTPVAWGWVAQQSPQRVLTLVSSTPAREGGHLCAASKLSSARGVLAAAEAIAM